MNVDTNHEDDCLPGHLTDLNAILDHIDDACGRPEAVCAYVLSLRDLQRAHDLSQYPDSGVTYSDIDAAAAAVRVAFRRLSEAQRQHEAAENCVEAALT